MTIKLLYSDIFTSPEIQQYCENDVFEPSCQDDEVLLITHARYGRMRQGRCITGQHGQFGCQTDAQNFLDSHCSGRRSCSVTVATLVPEKEQPCSRDLRSYLEVVNQCVKGNMDYELSFLDIILSKIDNFNTNSILCFSCPCVQ